MLELLHLRMTFTFGEFNSANDLLEMLSTKTENTEFNGFSFALADNKETIDDLVKTTTDVQFHDIDFYATVLSNQTQSDGFPPQQIAEKTDNSDISDLIKLSLSINQFFIQICDQNCTSDEEIIDTYIDFVSLFNGGSEETNIDTIHSELESAKSEFSSDEVVSELSELFKVDDRPEVLFRIRVINQNLLNTTLQSMEYFPDNEPSVGDYLVFELEQPTKEEFDHIQEHMKDRGANKFRVDDTRKELPDELEFATETNRKFYRVICKVTDSQYNENREYNEYDYYVLAHNTDVQAYYPDHPLFKSDTVIEPAVQSQYEIYPERPSGEIELVDTSSIFTPDFSMFVDPQERQ